MTNVASNLAGDLKQVAVRGVLWSGAGTLLRQFVQVATSLLLARLLAPEIFGLLAMAMVFIEIAQLFVDFGLGLAVVQARNPSPVLLSSCFWLSSSLATAVALLLSGCAPVIAVVYGDQRVTMLMPFLSLNLIISGMVAIPYAILQRELRFASLAKIGFIGSFVGSVVAVILAARGFGVWSLVIQPLAGTGTTSILAFTTVRWRPRWEFSWCSLQGVIHFSSGVFGATLLNYCMRNGDNFLVGRYLGADLLGYYSMSYRLMLFPLSQVSNAIGRVTYPILAGLQDDLDRYRRLYLRSCAAIAFVTFPMMCGLFVVADQFVATVLGSKWLGATMVLKILCPVGLLQSVGTTVGNIFNSTGHTRKAFLWTLAATPVTVAAFAVGLIWGIEGVAACYAVVSAILTLLCLRLAFRIVGLSLGSLGVAICRPLACALLMAVGVYAFDRIVLSGSAAGLIRLGGDVLVGGVLYVLLSAQFNKRDLLEFSRHVRSALMRGLSPSGGNAARL